MTCQECLARYSEFVDDLMDGESAALWRSHLERCSSCSRYHQVMQHGLQMLNRLPEIRPSEDFQARLQHRVFHLQDEMWRHDRFASTGAAVSLVVAALIALVAWAPVLVNEFNEQAQRAEVANANVAAEPEAGTLAPSIVPESELLPPAWYTQRGSMGSGTMTSLNAAFPGPYSPLIVEAPFLTPSRGVRVVFTSLPGIE